MRYATDQEPKEYKGESEEAASTGSWKALIIELPVVARRFL